jgi:ADP-heptose:LPS heptosyltransferase
MGDVAMSAHVLRAVTEQYPDNEYIFLTGRLFRPFFRDIKHLDFVHPDLNDRHKGISGIFKLYKEIKKEYKPDLVIDIHNVIRSKLLRFLFRLSSVKSYTIEKGRREKRKLISKKNKKRVLLKHTVQRYADTFLKANLKVKVELNELNKNKQSKEKKGSAEITIGIAPFAKHLQKQYPIDMMKELIQLLNERKYMIYIFGGGKKEKEFAEDIEKKYKYVNSVIGKRSFEEEIDLISTLDLMITMDSGNMHIAALTGIKILSIWGATHPYAGFTPYISDKKSFIVQKENLECRPCSVFGNKKCFKGTIECLTEIKPKQLLNTIEIAIEN